MDVSDEIFSVNHDWDPVYLSEIVTGDFFEFDKLWDSKCNVSDVDLLKHVENMEHYCPIVEDISMDDEILCSAVEKIKQE